MLMAPLLERVIDGRLIVTEDPDGRLAELSETIGVSQPSLTAWGAL
jgi:hypothetical protein